MEDLQNLKKINSKYKFILETKNNLMYFQQRRF